MAELNRNKFWIGIVRGCEFTEGDNRILRIWPQDFADPDMAKKNLYCDMMPKFLVDQDLEGARRQALFFVNKMFNDYAKVDRERGVPVPSPQSPAGEGLDSLTIEGSAPVPQGNASLLNLGDLLK